MQTNEQFLSVIEKLTSKVKPVEAFVEFVASKIVPTVSARAACPGSKCGTYWGAYCGCTTALSPAVPCYFEIQLGRKQYRRYQYQKWVAVGFSCGQCTTQTCKIYTCGCQS